MVHFHRTGSSSKLNSFSTEKLAPRVRLLKTKLVVFIMITANFVSNHNVTPLSVSCGQNGD